jgi:TatD DNase family protein
MLIDVHAHLDYYEEDLPAVLEEIEGRKILTITSSVNPSAYRRNLEIAAASPLIVPTFGVHPLWAPEFVDRLDELEPFLQQTPIIAELGLDHYRAKDPTDYPAQREVFAYLLESARRQDKPITVHTKAAEEEVLEMLDRFGIRRAIIHWYQGPPDVLHELAARGYHFSIGFEVLSVPHVQEIARAVPEGQLLTETDNPAARSRMETQPMPSLIEDVIAGLAEVRGTTPEAIEALVERNFRELVGDDAWLSGTGIG